MEIFLCFQFYLISMSCQYRIKFLCHLHKHIGQIQFLFFQENILEIILGDLKKFLDQPLQPFGLFQGNVGILFLLGLRHIRGLVKKGQIPQDRSQRGFQIMGKVCDQIIFPLSLLLQRLLLPDHTGLDLQHTGSYFCVGCRKHLFHIQILRHISLDLFLQLFHIFPGLPFAVKIKNSSYCQYKNKYRNSKEYDKKSFQSIPVDHCLYIFSPIFHAVCRLYIKKPAFKPVHKASVQNIVHQKIHQAAYSSCYEEDQQKF